MIIVCWQVELACLASVTLSMTKKNCEILSLRFHNIRVAIHCIPVIYFWWLSIQETSSHKYQFSVVLVFTDLSYRWPHLDGGLPKMTTIWKPAGNTINNKWRNPFVSSYLQPWFWVFPFDRLFINGPHCQLQKKEFELQDIVCIHLKLSCSDLFGLHFTLELISAKFSTICFTNGIFNSCSTYDLFDSVEEFIGKHRYAQVNFTLISFST